MTISGTLSNKVVSAQQVQTRTLMLNGVVVNGIVTELLNNSPTNYLLTTGAIAPKLNELTATIDALDPNGTGMMDLSIISQYCNDPFFTGEDDWLLTDWQIVDNRLQLLGCPDNNRAQLNTERVFKNAGRYYFGINIAELPVGTVRCYLNDVSVSKTTKTGLWIFELNITDIFTDQVYLTMENGATELKVSIDKCGVFFIAERFVDYLEYKIRAIASVDASDFVTKDQLVDELKKVSSQLLSSLADHVAAHNPHNVTPDMIGAAPVEHTHSQYVTSDDIGILVENQMSGYAKKNHTHDEYLTVEEGEELAHDVLDQRISELVSTDRMVVSQAPIGILLPTFNRTGITEPLAILIPSTIAHNEESPYDDQYGVIDSANSNNVWDIIAPYAPNSDLPLVEFAAKQPTVYRLAMHASRRLSGYKIYMQLEQANCRLDSITVLSGNGTFFHRVMDVYKLPMVDVDIRTKCIEISFEQTTQVDGLCFIINVEQTTFGDDDIVHMNCRIALTFDDYDTSSFAVTAKTLEFSVPAQSTNRLIKRDAVLNATVITPEFRLSDLPYYVFAIKDDDIGIRFEGSHIPPEYSATPSGRDMLHDKYTELEADYSRDVESYIHPVFGTLSIDTGKSLDGIKLSSIYSDDGVWVSDDSSSLVTIVQTFNSNNVVVRAYSLQWPACTSCTNADPEKETYVVPDTWSLVIEGTRSDGTPETIVVDSVTNYHPLSLHAEDDVIYYARLHAELAVKTVKLMLQTTKHSGNISLGVLRLFVTERYYNISQNTMYLGVTPESSICLGYARWVNELIGWQVQNIVRGKSCTIPINNLVEVPSFTEHVIPNPFFSKDVNVQIQSTLNSHAGVTSIGSAEVVSVSEDAIVVYCGESAIYNVAISRTW